MFDNLSDRLEAIYKKLKGRGILKEADVDEALREIRVSFIEADVSLSVIKSFLDKVREKAVGKEVLKSLTPGHQMVKIVNDELVRTMGAENDTLNLTTQPPGVILMAGLQGAGKTTSTAKLALWLKNREKKKVMVVSTDVYRPAAIDQLRTLAAEAEIDFFESDPSQKPADIAKNALAAAKKQFADVLIVDTPHGRQA